MKRKRINRLGVRGHYREIYLLSIIIGCLEHKRCCFSYSNRKGKSRINGENVWWWMIWFENVRKCNGNQEYLFKSVYICYTLYIVWKEMKHTMIGWNRAISRLTLKHGLRWKSGTNYRTSKRIGTVAVFRLQERLSVSYVYRLYLSWERYSFLFVRKSGREEQGRAAGCRPE